MDLENVQYFARGCFLAGTLISTPLGSRPIELLRRGDTVISFNENTGKKELSKINEIDVLKRKSYYNINNSVKATADHPFYTPSGKIKTVKNLKIGDKLVDSNNNPVVIESIDKVAEDVVVYNLLDVTPNNNYYANDFLVHNKGCFLPNTRIVTPTGTKKIKDVRPGDTVVSLNETTGVEEYSKVSSVQVFSVSDYYTINDTIDVTAEHPMYVSTDEWNLKSSLEVREVQNIKVGDYLVTDAGTQEVRKIEKKQKNTQVYNLINVTPNHNYYAGDKITQYLVHNKGGGGCFLAGTKITTVSGQKAIEDIKSGDRIWTLNEATKMTEVGVVQRLDEIKASSYYVINGEIKTTGTHPFYTTKGIKSVSDLQIGDYLIKNFDVKTEIKTIEYIEDNVTVYNLINVDPNHNYLANSYLVHNKGFSGGGRSFSSGSSAKTTSSSTGGKGSTLGNGSSYNSSSSRSTTSASTKPGSRITTNDGKEITTSANKPSNSRVNQQAGITGVDGYTPRFTNGYSAPAGSVVYYPEHSFIDYLPWVYLFSQDSPTHDQATIVQPDGKEFTAQPVQEGADGLAFFNWIVLIVIGIAIIGGVVWLINRLTNKGGY